jgi:hypothetical protein
MEYMHAKETGKPGLRDSYQAKNFIIILHILV